MMEGETPSSVMYADLRYFGGITNKDAARMLLSPKVSYGGRAPRDRVDERTFLSREVVHVMPDRVNPSLFADFSLSSQDICARMTSRLGANAHDRIISHYANVASDAMQDVLLYHRRDATLYRNEVARIMGVSLRREQDRAVLLLMLFCATGCLGDARDSVRIVESFSHAQLAFDMGTVVAGTRFSFSTTGDAHDALQSLGLLRVVDGAVRPPIHPLNPSGTVVGAHGDISDVGVDVSRNHVRIWRDADGCWYCQGMNSTNGTMVRRALDGSIVVIEPPRRGRTLPSYPPVEIQDGDDLLLGANTYFRVMPLGN